MTVSAIVIIYQQLTSRQLTFILHMAWKVRVKTELSFTNITSA